MGGEMGCIPAEHIREHEHEDKEFTQGVENAPDNTENGLFVFLDEIAFDQP